MRTWLDWHAGELGAGSLFLSTFLNALATFETDARASEEVASRSTSALATLLSAAIARAA